jgi:hypothetical protein
LSGNNQHGTLAGPPVWATGQHGPALDFDQATLQRVQLGTTLDPPATGISIVMWVKWTDIGASASYEVLMSKRDTFAAADMRWQLSGITGDGSREVRWNREGTTNVNFGSVLVSGRWQHLVLTQNAANVILYLDAQVVNSLTAMTFGTDAAAIVTIGSNENEASAFNGLIDDVRLYSRALTPAEVAWLYTDPFADMARPRRIVGRGEFVAPTFVPFPFRGDGGFDNMMGGLR